MDFDDEKSVTTTVFSTASNQLRKMFPSFTAPAPPRIPIATLRRRQKMKLEDSSSFETGSSSGTSYFTSASRQSTNYSADITTNSEYKNIVNNKNPVKRGKDVPGNTDRRKRRSDSLMKLLKTLEKRATQSTPLI